MTNIIEDLVSDVDTIIDAEPAVESTGQTIVKQKRKPRRTKAQKDKEKKEAEEKKNSILEPESEVIEWKEIIKRNNEGDIVYKTGSYKLDELFNELNSILTPRGARYTYEKIKGTIHINGMFGHIVCLNLQSPKENILRVARTVPTRRGIVGSGEV